MRIGIDARVLGTDKALDRYTRSLLTNLLKIDRKNSYLLFIDDKEKVKPWENEADYFLLPPKKVLSDHLRFARLIKNTNVDLIFHPDNTEFFNCFPNSVVTLHDVIPWKFPEMILSKNPLLRARQMLYFKLQESALRKSCRIITVSEHSKKDINKIIGIPLENITVIYEGIEESFNKKGDPSVLNKYDIKGDYIFYIGGFSPHKNVLSLVKAFGLLPDKNIKLVLGGKSDETKGGQSSFREILTEIIKSNLKERVKFAGYINESDLPTFYQNAKVFVYPSLYEGFGFPPLEAMKAGTGVITSGRASLDEVLADGYFKVDTSNSQALAAAINELISNNNLRNDLVKRGKKIADRYNWEETAANTLKVFEQLKN